MSATRDQAQMRRLEKRFARVEKSVVDAHQRLARTVLPGKIKERRFRNNDWEVRADFGDGVLSPWVKMTPVATGAMKIKVKPTIGAAVSVISPSGVVGAASWAVHRPFDEDHEAPTGQQDVVFEKGRTRIEYEDGKVTITNGDSSIVMDGKTIDLASEKLTHNGVNISYTHRHTGVTPGLANTGPPVS